MVYAHGGHKDPRGYLGVDSNDGARGALRQISLPIAAKVDITSARSLIAGLQSSLAPLQTSSVLSSYLSLSLSPSREYGSR